MDLRIIKTDSEYQAALSRLVKMIDQNPPGDSPEADEIELLSMLIEHYEAKTYPPISFDPDPIEEIEFHLDRLGLTRRDLIPILGSESRVSEILNRKRPLTLAMIRRLHKELGMSADVLLELTGPASIRKAS